MSRLLKQLKKNIWLLKRGVGSSGNIICFLHAAVWPTALSLILTPRRNWVEHFIVSGHFSEHLHGLVSILGGGDTTMRGQVSGRSVGAAICCGNLLVGIFVLLTSLSLVFFFSHVTHRYPPSYYSLHLCGVSHSSFPPSVFVFFGSNSSGFMVHIVELIHSFLPNTRVSGVGLYWLVRGNSSIIRNCMELFRGRV